MKQLRAKQGLAPANDDSTAGAPTSPPSMESAPGKPSVIRRAGRALYRRAGFVSLYQSRFDWIASYYDAVVRAAPGMKWPGAGRVVRVGLQGLSTPLHLRLGTTDWFVAEEVFLRKVYATVQGAAPPDTRTILDLGANVGLTLLLWHAWWPEARMLAVEPDDDNLRVQALNVAPFAHQVRAIRACAVGAEREVVLDRGHGEAAYRMSDYGPVGAPRVPGRSIARILDDHKVGVIDLLKCDIEGAEHEVFASCEAWIHRIRCIVVEVHGDFGIPELMEIIARRGGRFEQVASGDPTVAVLRPSR